MPGRPRRRQPLVLVRESESEDADFDERFRRERVKRWARGVRNGMGLGGLVRYRLGREDALTFAGARVRSFDSRTTCRVIEDIWMRGEYDLPGFVPQRGWRVLDLGANVGIYAMLAASRGARVVAYEPHPEVFESLRANTARWDVDCHCAAIVGVARGSARLFLHGRDTRSSLFRSGGGNAAERSLEVPAVPVADVLTRPYDLVKVDCEGAEFEIFAAADDTALRNAKRFVVEVHGDAGDPEALARRVASAGFETELGDPYPGMPFRFLTARRR